MSRQSLKLLSPLRVRGSQSKIKRAGFVLFLASGATTFVINSYNTECELHYDRNPFNNQVVRSCRELNKKEFRPTWYLPTAFLQGLYGAKFDPVPYLPLEREVLKLKDGGEAALDWGPVLGSVEKKEDTRVLFILHGLTGASETNYVRSAIIIGQKNSYRTVVFNHRGMSNTPLKTPEYHNLADMSDVRAAIAYIKEKYPKAPLYGLGISFGANMLVRHAGETGDQCEMEALVSIANPFDLKKCSDQISRPLKFIYHWNLLNNFRRNIRRNYDQLKNNTKIDVDEVLKSKTIKEYDEKFSIKLSGHKTVDEYYRDASCIDLVEKVKIPVLTINSLDDPVIDTKEVLPLHLAKKNSNLIMMTTPRGGHIDWITNKWRRRWVYWPSIEFLNYIDNTNHPKASTPVTEDPTVKAVKA